MTNEEFIKEVFEIAFGDGATCVENNDNEVKAREFTKEEVLEQLKEFSDNALKYENSKEPEKPKNIQEHFDECLRHWSRHG
jgi:hypothetical protein